jgi:hypothetical protein
MPRNRRAARESPYEPLDIERLTAGVPRTEVRAGREWNVRSVSAVGATKTYVCPGCPQPIEIGVAHVVAWRADGVLGDAADVDGRRHWHSACWRVS